MAQPPSRGIIRMILGNFIKSLTPRQIRGNYMGTDTFGNKFFEIPVSSSSSKSKPTRWFEPVIKDDFQSEMSSEWESWLRGRRKIPPTDEEIARNLAIMEMKKKNAIEVDAKGSLPAPMEKGFESFPLRSEFEQVPGVKTKKD
ncbi:NADH dehydrogenase [ubiquinone] 1 alpha subcomplex assembly factor 2 [Euwallacea similis]|uniref:NADH dehydrogenase [ubiquinone] 1 alpha subcomplex assembly factor 2 n=1 Tax=Euwallacea similis TaxID=1736056 RepID=UPI00344F528B